MKERYKKKLQQSFLRMLVEGNCSFTEEELKRWNHSLSLSMQGGNWACVVVRMSEADYTGKYIGRLERQCEKVISEQELRGYVILGSNMDVAILLQDSGKDHREILKIIGQNLSHSMTVPVRLGVGLFYGKLSDLHFSKEEAYEALEWGGELIQVADIRDAHPGRIFSEISVQDGCRQIIERFRWGAVEKLHSDLEVLVEQIRANTIIHPNAPYPTSIRRTMIELLVEMLHIASDEGVDVDTEIGHVDPYRKIFELQGTPAIIQWVVETTQVLSQAMQSRKKRMELTQLEQVKAYIDSHLADMELNLTSASQSVGMSPSYFSAFFIREAGIGFKEYVTDKRIELAKKLLKESKDSINTISEQCGFLSPSYFITVFKNQTGITPGTYRKNEKLKLCAE